MTNAAIIAAVQAAQAAQISAQQARALLFPPLRLSLWLRSPR